MSQSQSNSGRGKFFEELKARRTTSKMSANFGSHFSLNLSSLQQRCSLLHVVFAPKRKRRGRDFAAQATFTYWASILIQTLREAHFFLDGCVNATSSLVLSQFQFLKACHSIHLLFLWSKWIDSFWGIAIPIPAFWGMGPALIEPLAQVSQY